MDEVRLAQFMQDVDSYASQIKALDELIKTCENNLMRLKNDRDNLLISTSSIKQDALESKRAFDEEVEKKNLQDKIVSLFSLTIPDENDNRRIRNERIGALKELSALKAISSADFKIKLINLQRTPLQNN